MPITTEAELINLIDTGTQENLTLEYKRCAALQNNEQSKSEISKDVSAFANSAGGVLIYGVLEDNQLPTALDAGFDLGQLSREWLEQVILSRIQPRVPGVVITPIALSGANAGRFAFAVEISQSHTAHQAWDNKYYKRNNFTVTPMEDYEVRDVMNRAKTPLVLASFDFQRHNRGEDTVDYLLRTWLHNQGDVTAHHMRIEIGLPVRFIDNNVIKFRQQRRMNTFEGRSYEELICVGEIADHVLFPDQQLFLGEWGYGGPMLRMNHGNFQLMGRTRAELTWAIYADDMRRQEGRIPLGELIDY